MLNPIGLNLNQDKSQASIEDQIKQIQEKLFNSSKKQQDSNKEFLSEIDLENKGLNFQQYKFYNQEASTGQFKSIRQIHQLMKNFNKNREARIHDDANLDQFLANSNFNIKRLDRLIDQIKTEIPKEAKMSKKDPKGKFDRPALEGVEEHSLLFSMMISLERKPTKQGNPSQSKDAIIRLHNDQAERASEFDRQVKEHYNLINSGICNSCSIKKISGFGDSRSRLMSRDHEDLESHVDNAYNALNPGDLNPRQIPYTPHKNIRQFYSHFSSLGDTDKSKFSANPNDNLNINYILQNIKGLKDPENSKDLNEESLKEFDLYFSALKPYFHYGCDLAASSISQDSLDKGIQTGRSSLDLQIPKSEVPQKLKILRESIGRILERSPDDPQSNRRKAVLDLLYSQLYVFVAESDPRLSSLISASLDFLQKRSLKLINQSLGNANDLADGKSLKYDTVQTYAKEQVHAKLDMLNSQAGDRNVKGLSSSSSRKEYELWCTVFYLLRSGLKQESLTFLKRESSSELSEAYTHVATWLEKQESQLLPDPETQSKIELLENCLKAKDPNPYLCACLCLVLKVNEFYNHKIFNTMEDYIWYHLSIIPSSRELRSLEASSLGFRRVSLFDFQEHMLQSGLNKDSPYDCVLFYFLIGLAADAVSLLGRLGDHVVHLGHFAYLLHQSEFVRNYNNMGFSDRDDVALEQDPRLSDCSKPKERTSKLLEGILYEFYSVFKSKRGSLLLFYLRNFRSENSPFKSSCHKQLALAGSILKDSKNIRLLLDPARSILFNINERDITLSDLIRTDEEFQEIVRKVIEESLMTQARTDDGLIPIGLRYNLYDEVIDLLFNDFYIILNSRIPSKLYNQRIFNRTSSNSNEQGRAEHPSVRNISDYKKHIDALGMKTKHLNQLQRNSFESLMKLEVLEKVFVLISKGEEIKALEDYLTYINVIPFRSLEEVSDFSIRFSDMHPVIKSYVPEMVYTLLYLIQSRLDTLRNYPSNYKQSYQGNLVDVNKEMARLKGFLGNLSELVDKLKEHSFYQGSREKFQEIANIIIRRSF